MSCATEFLTFDVKESKGLIQAQCDKWANKLFTKIYKYL